MTSRLTWICTAAIVLALAASPALAADVYKVSARISHGEDEIGSPVLLVNHQSPATVSLSGGDGYDFSVRLVRVDGSDELEVTVELATSLGRVSSVVTTGVGRPILVATGEIGLSVTVTREDG